MEDTYGGDMGGEVLGGGGRGEEGGAYGVWRVHMAPIGLL